jgi:hypothetical protein
MDYALDQTDGWEILRFSFLWPKDFPHTLNNPCLILRAQRITLPCDVQFISEVNCAPFTVAFCHPQNKATYHIEITSCEAQQVSFPQNQDEKCKRPEYVCILEYRVNPALPDGDILSLRDCIDNNSPICLANGDLGETSVFGIFSKPDSTSAVAVPKQSSISASHFEPITRVEWQVELQTTSFAPESFPL